MNLDNPKRKLTEHAAGSYKSIEETGQSFKLDLLEINPIFTPDQLRRASRIPPLCGQIKDCRQQLKLIRNWNRRLNI